MGFRTPYHRITFNIMYIHLGVTIGFLSFMFFQHISFYFIAFFHLCCTGRRHFLCNWLSEIIAGVFETWFVVCISIYYMGTAFTFTIGNFSPVYGNFLICIKNIIWNINLKFVLTTYLVQTYGHIKVAIIDHGIIYSIALNTNRFIITGTVVFTSFTGSIVKFDKSCRREEIKYKKSE